jgi:hypothetical protein
LIAFTRSIHFQNWLSAWISQSYKATELTQSSFRLICLPINKSGLQKQRA